MSKIADALLKQGTDPELLDVLDQIIGVLNNGRYQMRVIEEEPDFENNEGEMLIQVSADGLTKKLWFFDGEIWNSIEFSSSSSVNLLSVAASQAEMEAGTDNTKGASAANMKWSPGAAKAWCTFDGTVLGTNAVTAGHNITNATRNGVGDYTVTFDTAFSSAFFIPLFAIGNGAATTLRGANIYARTTTTLRFTVQTTETNALADVSDICLAVFGDF